MYTNYRCQASFDFLLVSAQTNMLILLLLPYMPKAAQLDQQLCFALYRASSHLTSVYRPILESINLTYPQFVVMMALWENDGISISQLANRSSLSKATMTPLLKRLESKQLIGLERVVNNERQKQVTLTKKGLALSSMSASATEKAFKATGLSQKQAADMIALCQTIVSPN